MLENIKNGWELPAAEVNPVLRQQGSIGIMPGMRLYIPAGYPNMPPAESRAGRIIGTVLKNGRVALPAFLGCHGTQVSFVYSWAPGEPLTKLVFSLGRQTASFISFSALNSQKLTKLLQDTEFVPYRPVEPAKEPSNSEALEKPDLELPRFDVAVRIPGKLSVKPAATANRASILAAAIQRGNQQQSRLKGNDDI